MRLNLLHKVVAIRGGVPLCYPWFGGVKQPPHGTARLRLWQLSDYDLQANKVRLEFSLFSEYGVIEAKMKMEFTDKMHNDFNAFRSRTCSSCITQLF